MEIRMDAYQERVVVEKAKLKENIDKLTDFMHCNTYAELPAVEQGLLMVQLTGMNVCHDALVRRVELFENN